MPHSSPTALQIVRSEWERVVAWSAVASAVVVLVVGHRHLAASPFGSEEVAYLISAGGGALLLVVLAVGFLVAADLRDEAHKLNRIEGALRGIDDAISHQCGVRSLWLAGTGFGLGTVVVVSGWRSAAGTGDLGTALDALPQAAAGLGLSVAAVAGYTVWLRSKVLARVRRLLRISVPETLMQSDVDAVGERGVDRRLWVVAGQRLVHRASCPALAFAEGGRSLVLKPEATGLAGCRLCEAEV